MLVAHLLASRRDRSDLLCRELDSLYRVRRRGDHAPAHDLHEVRAALELLSGRLEHLRDAVGGTAEGLRVPRTAARAASGRSEVSVAPFTECERVVMM